MLPGSVQLAVVIALIVGAVLAERALPDWASRSRLSSTQRTLIDTVSIGLLWFVYFSASDAFAVAGLDGSIVALGLSLTLLLGLRLLVAWFAPAPADGGTPC